MLGTKHISDLITDPQLLSPGRINLIEANVSAGKTHFALDTVPKWAGTPAKVLYLIDTNNGECRIQQNIITVSRQTYQLCLMFGPSKWGEIFHDADDKMPVMTYAGFGSEVRNDPKFPWHDFDYIICDEMQNLIKYQTFKGEKKNLIAAENALRTIVTEGKATVVALSATPRTIKEHYGELCYEVPFDRSDLVRLETFERLPYKTRTEEIISQNRGKKGILYTTRIEDMKKYIQYANSIHVRADGFWSTRMETQLKHSMSAAQFELRRTVLDKETIPDNIDLLVINAASETCIKIQEAKCKVDYMIIHDQNEEIQIQVRGRYHGDLPRLYYHDIEAANNLACQNLPVHFLDTRLYEEGKKALCDYLDLRKPKDPYGPHYMWPKSKEYLCANGYSIEEKKDSKRNGARYAVISQDVPK